MGPQKGFAWLRTADSITANFYAKKRGFWFEPLAWFLIWLAGWKNMFFQRKDNAKNGAIWAPGKFLFHTYNKMYKYTINGTPEWVWSLSSFQIPFVLP